MGITVLYEAIRRGRQAILFEREADILHGASYANGGVLHPSAAAPWNSPGIGGRLLASLFDKHAAVKLHGAQLPALLFWGLSFLRHSTPYWHAQASKANFALAAYSTHACNEVGDALKLAYDAAASGMVKIFRNKRALQNAIYAAHALAGAGLRYQVLTRDALCAREPLLAPAIESIAGGLFFPDDRVGDARLFCQHLAQIAVAQGGEIRCATPITRLYKENGKIAGLYSQDEKLTGDVVLTAGYAAYDVAKQAGINLPIRPAKGYSLSIDASGLGDDMPRHALVDDAVHIALTPFKTRLRILGMAEFSGRDRHISPDRLARLRQFFHTLYPAASARLDWDGAQGWAGLRPMSADGKPFIGKSASYGLWLNCGHGHLGWTQAMGSAIILLDQIEGKKTAIDARPFSADKRLRHQPLPELG